MSLSVTLRAAAVRASKDLSARVAAETARVLVAQRAALDAWSKEARDRLRADLASGVRSRGRNPKRLANTVRALAYPSRGLAYAPSAAISIAQSVRRIVDAGEEGAVITATRRRLLTIPIPGSPAEISNGRVMTDPRGPVTRARFIARQLGAELVMIPPAPGRPGLLVARGGEGRFVSSSFRRKAGQMRGRDGRLKRGVTAITRDVPLFFLVPVARVPRRFSTRAIAAGVAAGAPGRFGQLFTRAHAALDGMSPARLAALGATPR